MLGLFPAGGFFRVLIGRILNDACTSSFGSNSDVGVFFCNFLGRPSLHFCNLLDGCVFVKFGCSSRMLSLDCTVWASGCWTER